MKHIEVDSWVINNAARAAMQIGFVITTDTCPFLLGKTTGFHSERRTPKCLWELIFVFYS